MIREVVAPQLDHDPHFRWRGENVTRIENLSDIVFALAMGMAILSSDIPQTFEELQGFLLNIIPAMLSFILLLQIWHAHFTFFRRFGVADSRIILYNVILLFFVLFAAYPLRFAFEGFFYYLYGFYDNWAKAGEMNLGFKRSGYILAYFCIGYGVINACYFLMYKYVLGKTDILELSRAEIILAKGSRAMFAFMSGLCVVTALICSLTPAYGFGGWLLALNWPFGVWTSRKYDPHKTLPAQA